MVPLAGIEPATSSLRGGQAQARDGGGEGADGRCTQPCEAQLQAGQAGGRGGVQAPLMNWACQYPGKARTRLDTRDAWLRGDPT